MFKAKLESVAQGLASDKGLAYGFCIFGGSYYVGTPAELNRIGCIDITTTPDGAKQREQRAILSYVEDGCGEHG